MSKYSEIANLKLTWLLLITTGLIQLIPKAGYFLEYSERKLLNGEFWRLITGHLTHYSFRHFILDVLVFFVLCLVIEQKIGSGKLLSLIIFTSAASSFLFLSFSFLHSMDSFRGLSGLNALLMIFLAVDLGLESKISVKMVSLAVIIIFISKIIIELITGSPLLSEPEGEIKVLTSIHLICGFIGGMMYPLLNSGRWIRIMMILTSIIFVMYATEVSLT